MLVQISIELSAEKNKDRLLKSILANAMELTHADGGTFYIVTPNEQLEVVLLANKTLHIYFLPPKEMHIAIKNIDLFYEDKPNLRNVVSYCYHQGQTVNIKDAYQVEGFDFSNMRIVDKELGYHSTSMLAMPLRDHEGKILGVLQLINAIDEKTDRIVAFSEERILLAESLASFAAITLTKQALIESQRILFESLIALVAKAIDEKSKHTSNHCIRVPIITNMIANAVNLTTEGPLSRSHLSKAQSDELNIAAWLHDCGKLITPEHVVNKSTKLETIYDRIELIKMRLAIIKRDHKIHCLEKCLNGQEKRDKADQLYQAEVTALSKVYEFLQKINQGGESISEEDKNRLQQLMAYTYQDDGSTRMLITPEEMKNLLIERGTLNEEEREIIKNHVVVTEKMLKSLPYPEHLKNVPDIAACHHEFVDGKGYPRGLNKDQLSIQARILTIADIFESLTAPDRPYKKAMKLTQVLKIMQKMKEEGHIDAELFDLFCKQKVYLQYAEQFLPAEQIDI